MIHKDVRVGKIFLGIRVLIFVVMASLSASQPSEVENRKQQGK